MQQVWKAFEENVVTHSAVHHLIAIAQLIDVFGYARITDVANRLDITRGSVSITLSSMEKNGFVQRDANRFLRLTPEGKFIAQTTQIKKVLLKRFLQEVLGIKEKDADIDSCKIEHLISLETGHRLCELMHFLDSGHPAAKAFLQAFRESYEIHQCEGENCQLCEDHCLLTLDS
ncbi:metal-dependent transcriptional regulator [Acidobacteria bacterium AH-259-O06]|nr:metal-dependent transcriptional regulator [Acidobacteria bacterium AH-259-O06]